MVYTYWELIRTPVTADGTWSTSDDVTLTEFHDVTVRVSLGEIRDTFQFKVTNTSGEFDNYFQPQDKLTISRSINTSTIVESTDLLMIGTIQGLPQQETFSTNMIRVEGYNFSEAVMSAITFTDAKDLVIPVALETALNAITAYNPNFSVTWNSNNPTVKSDTTAFPTIGKRWFNKPIRDQLEDWSKADNTQDGNYYWYVDNNNELIWRRMSEAIDFEFDSSTDNHRTLEISRDASDVKNWVILQGGLDLNNSPITERVQDLTSIAKHGLRYHYIDKENKAAKSYISVDQAALDAASYPFNSAWGESVSSSSDYNDKLRVRVKAELVVAGEAYLEDKRLGKLQLQIETMPGEYAWKLGNNIDCRVPQLTKSGATTPLKLMRVKEIIYTSTSDTFVLEEDEGTV